MMLLSYLPVLIIVGFVTFLVIVVFFINSLLSPKNPYKDKLSPWECGMEPIGNDASAGHFKVHFFIIAILFIVFDAETLYLFPWAVVLKKLGMVAFVEMFIFIAILLIGLIYAWAKGALEWV
ncbi:MAG: NADH-quinone oxidoreductase subunit A [Deltaproteobacteria bacterium]|nr:NADH-quinone oxidoreductase subunit A [Deltaproteobacteria bacterium]